MRILLIESDHSTARAIAQIALLEKFYIGTADSGEEGIELAKLYEYDVVVLDLKLHDMSGFDVLRAIRLGKMRVPVLMLSSANIVEAKVKALALGADDYLIKPFHKDELVARIKALVRRSMGHAQAVIATGKLVVNLDAKTVEANGRPLHVTAKEYQMLELLSLRKGVALSKDVFLNHLYGGMDEPAYKILDVFICKLRKKIAEACDGEQYIHTVWGFGHALRDPSDRQMAA